MKDPYDLLTVEQRMAKQVFQRAKGMIPQDVFARIRQEGHRIAILKPQKALARLRQAVQRCAPKSAHRQLVDHLADEAAASFRITVAGFRQHFQGERLRRETEEYVVRLIVGCWAALNLPKAVEPKQGDRLVCFSYAPLLYPPSPAGSTYDAALAETLLATEPFTSQPDLSAATACLWGRSEAGVVMPVFLMHRGREIAEHLVEWAEGQPGEWFTLDVAAAGDGYAILLAPDIKRSVARFGAAYRMRHGQQLPQDTPIKVICRPLHFVTENGPTFKAIRQEIPSKTPLGILDQGEVDLGDLQASLDPTKIVELGSFKVRWDPEETRSLLKELLDSAGGPQGPEDNQA